MYVGQFFVDGLGHNSYIVVSDDTGEAAVIDPRRDVDGYLREATRQGWKISYVLETHNHNDFISGAKELAYRAGAEHVASADAQLRFPHKPVREGDELLLGTIKINVIFTPGHTPEHVCYVLVDTSRAQAPILVFTGGDLLVGAVGRTDLLGPELSEKLASLLYDSLHDKILRLPDYVEVLPTHAGGSLCGRGINSKRTSTIGYERRFNPALQIASRDDFVREVLSGDQGMPSYYRRMRPINQIGPDPWRLPLAKALEPEEVTHLAGHGAIVLDVRLNVSFGGGHIPESVNIAAGPSLATWVGWLLPPDVPLILVLDDDDQWTDIVTALGRLGYESLAGYLRKGIEGWIAAGLSLEYQQQWTVHELRRQTASDGVEVLDVRTDAEWESGHVHNAKHRSLDTLVQRISELEPERAIATVCSSGYRSSIAASMLARNGFRAVANVVGGMSAWNGAGYPTTRS